MSSTNEFVTVAFEEEQYCRTKKGLAQWDREKTLRVYGISTDDTVQIHFSLAENYGEAVSVEAAISNGAIEASIPPFIFEKKTSSSQRVYYAYAFIYLLNGESAETVRKIIFEIETRPKPEDYVYYPEDVKTWSKKVNLPLDEAGNPDNGTAGQFAVSDGQGGITWLTVENESETSGDAADVTYDNTNSGLDADNAQEAIDKLSEEIDDLNPLKGKKISLLGDSICAGSSESTSYLGGYGKIIADRNNMTYQNLGQGGSTITAETYSSTTGGAKGWLCRMVENMDADADYAIIEGGVNDAWQWIDHGTIEIGEISNGFNAVLDDTTYYGAFESMLKKLITRFKGKKIGYIAIPRTMEFYSNSENVPNFYHIALECCAKWGVSVCDLNTITPPPTCLGTEYTADGIHPTYEGYLKYYCDPIEAWMKTLTTGGNNAYFTAVQAMEDYTQGFNDAIKALQDGKLDNTGISFRKALLPLADGTTLEIDVLTAIDGTVVIPYVNRVPISIDTDGSVFNDIGYMEGYRLSSGGVTKELAYSAVTGYIPVTNGDIIRIYGCGWATIINALNYVCAYDENFNFIGAKCTTAGESVSISTYGTSIFGEYSIDDNCNITFTLNCTSDIAYIRVSSLGDGSSTQWNYDPADMIVTVNEEII